MNYVKDWVHFLRGVRLGVAHSPDGWLMPLTASDVAWMCRALAGESSGVLGPPSDAVAWAMIQYAYARRHDTWDRRGGGWTLRPPHSLTEILLFYCQPINPYWRQRGDAAAIRRRNRFATMGPSECERTYPGLVARVLSLFRGGISSEPYTGLVEFMKSGLGEGTHGAHDAEFGGNWFWKSFGSGSWERGRVQVAPPAGVSVSRLIVPVGLQLATGATVAVGPKSMASRISIPFIKP
ncbi:MAG: hypothetical protein JXB32_15870 [Deltaproteobacteria bacterium]|nr:hypothetical protein [Deltaproteobacteria bacterium]